MEPACDPLCIYHTGYEKCQSRHSYGPAVRTQYLIHFVLSGKGFFRTAEQTYFLEANSVFLIQPEEITYYEADAQDPWEYCWVGFDGTDAKSLLEACGLLRTPVHRALPDEARNTILRLYREQISNRGNPILYKGLLYQFFSCFDAPKVHLRPLSGGEYIKTATEYLRRNYMYDISVAGLSAFIGIDRSYLYRLFLQWEGQSPQQYLLARRIEAAQRMLLESDHTVTEIAYSCGFRDISAFDKAFRKAAGRCPGAFRRSSEK